MTVPSWLPPLYEFDVKNEKEWLVILGKLHAIFSGDFVKRKCLFDGLTIVFNETIVDGYEEIFWHLITRTYEGMEEREPDFERARRLPWCRPTIENHKDPQIILWDYLETGKRINTYIWLVDFDYIVIIQKRNTVAFLLSAYHIDGERSKRKYLDKYNRRVI